MKKETVNIVLAHHDCACGHERCMHYCRKDGYHECFIDDCGCQAFKEIVDKK